MGPILPEMLSTGFAMALMLCVVDLGSTIFQRANNLLGETYIAAHTASRRIIAIMMQPLHTIGVANSTFVGQNWGAKKVDRIRSTLKKVIGVELLWAVFACGVIWLFGGALVRFTTGASNEATIQNAVLSLRFHFSCLPAYIYFNFIFMGTSADMIYHAQQCRMIIRIQRRYLFIISISRK